MFKKILILLIIAGFVLSGCGGPSEEALVEAAIQTIEARPTETLTPTATLTPTPESTPTWTPAPTATKPIILNPEAQKFALNWLGEQTQGGITIEIVRVLIGEKAVIDQPWDVYESLFSDIVVVGEILFRVTNTTDKVLNVDPIIFGRAIINQEQVDLADYLYTSLQMGNSFGEIYPGVALTGGLWFAIKHIPVAEVGMMTILIDAPTDEDGVVVGEDFVFVIDLTNHIFDDLPNELK